VTLSALSTSSGSQCDSQDSNLWNGWSPPNVNYRKIVNYKLLYEWLTYLVDLCTLEHLNSQPEFTVQRYHPHGYTTQGSSDQWNDAGARIQTETQYPTFHPVNFNQFEASNYPQVNQENGYVTQKQFRSKYIFSDFTISRV